MEPGANLEAVLIRSIIKKNQDIIESDTSLLQVCTEAPGIPTIKGKLVRSYLPALKPETSLA